MAPVSARVLGAVAAFCLLSVAFAAAAPDASQWASAAADAEWLEEEEQRAGQEADADADAYADADAQDAYEEETLRAGAEQQQGEAEADADLPEQEQQQQQQQQRVWKPQDEGRLGRLNDTQQKQQDAEREQRPQQTTASRQDDFGLEGRREQTPRQGSQQWGAQPQQPQMPPRDYTPLNRFGYFKVHVTPLGWLEALLTCASEGARLAVPRSAEEVRAVGALYGASKARVHKAQDRELFFVGASDLLKEGEFVTLLGTKFNSGHYHQWQKGEPNNHGKNEHCVLSNDKGLYWDGNCAKKFAFVCEYKDPCQNLPRGDNNQQPQPQWPSQPQPQPQWPTQSQPQPDQQQQWQQQQQQQQQQQPQHQQQQQWKQPQQQQQWTQG